MAKRRKSLLVHENTNTNNNDDFVLVRRSQKRPLTALFVIIFLLCLAGGIVGGSFFVDSLPEKEYCFELVGDKQVFLTSSDAFTDPGVKLIDKDNDRSEDVVVEASETYIDEDGSLIPGTYFIYYSIPNGSFKNVKLCRVLIVTSGGEE